MTAKPGQSRYQGRGLVSWQADIRTEIAEMGEMVKNHDTALKAQYKAIQQIADSVDSLREHVGSSTPLLIWNIAVLIAIAGLCGAVARLYGYAPY